MEPINDYETLLNTVHFSIMRLNTLINLRLLKQENYEMGCKYRVNTENFQSIQKDLFSCYDEIRIIANNEKKINL